MKITEGGLRRVIRQVIKESMSMDNKSGVDQALEILQRYGRQLDVMIGEDGLGKTHEKINKLVDYSAYSEGEREYLRSTVLLQYHGTVMRDLKIVYDKMLGQYPETDPYDHKVESLKKSFASESPIGREMSEIYDIIFRAQSMRFGTSKEPGSYQDGNKRIDLNMKEKKDIMFVKTRVKSLIRQIQDGYLSLE